MRARGRRQAVALAGGLALLPLVGPPAATGDERPKVSSQVQAPAQGGVGVVYTLS